MVLYEPELEPFYCDRFAVKGDVISKIDRIESANWVLGNGLVIIPGLLQRIRNPY